VSFAVQHRQEGYGHAVYQTKAFAGGEMVLLGLGDHLFRGRPVSPYRELADLSGVSGGRSVSAVNRITADELKGYGTIAGKRRPENSRLIDVSLIIEKPDPAVAREKLHVDGLPAETWLGWFGLHLLAPSTYDILEQMIRDDVRDNGEFQLTRAQELQRQREGYLAFEMTGAERFDFGVPDDFIRSVQAFRNP
jgi:UTP--glucose-1-phosphate uridylyltransferase